MIGQTFQNTKKLWRINENAQSLGWSVQVGTTRTWSEFILETEMLFIELLYLKKPWRAVQTPIFSVQDLFKGQGELLKSTLFGI